MKQYFCVVNIIILCLLKRLKYLLIAEGASSEDVDQAQGWGSWAWSYVPQILPYDDYDPDMEDYDGEKTVPCKPQPSVLVIGLYVAQANVVCKVRLNFMYYIVYLERRTGFGNGQIIIIYFLD